MNQHQVINNTVDVDALKSSVAKIVPLIAGKARDAEISRQPNDDVIKALEDTGVFRALVPREFGGYDLDLEAFVDIGAMVSRACPSTGWITTFYIEHNFLMTLFDKSVQRDVFANKPYVMMAGAVNPIGRGKRVEGGYLIEGRWPFGTGVVHADWVCLSGTLDGDAPGMRRMWLVPREDIVMEDTWHVDGMVATGSHDIVADKVFVPELYQSLEKPEPASYPVPIPPLLSLTAAVPALGCAQRAVELFEQRIRERTLFGTSTKQEAKAAAKMRLANTSVAVEQAQIIMQDVARKLTQSARSGQRMSDLEQQRLRLSLAHAVRRCRDVVREVMQSSGASVHYLHSELQRIHRDVHMMGGHTVFDVDLVAEKLGADLLSAEG